MDKEQINALMKYVRGEMSFAEWIESGGVTGDREQNDDDNEVEVQDDENEFDQEWDIAEQNIQDDAMEEQRDSGGMRSSEHSIEFLHLAFICPHYRHYRHHRYHHHHRCYRVIVIFSIYQLQGCHYRQVVKY